MSILEPGCEMCQVGYQRFLVFSKWEKPCLLRKNSYPKYRRSPETNGHWCIEIPGCPTHHRLPPYISRKSVESAEFLASTFLWRSRWLTSASVTQDRRPALLPQCCYREESHTRLSIWLMVHKELLQIMVAESPAKCSRHRNVPGTLPHQTAAD
jgi:hypothetical protein